MLHVPEVSILTATGVVLLMLANVTAALLLHRYICRHQPAVWQAIDRPGVLNGGNAWRFVAFVYLLGWLKYRDDLWVGGYVLAMNVTLIAALVVANINGIGS